MAVNWNGRIRHGGTVSRQRTYGSWWWSPARKAKLLYIMQTYNDMEKAQRVLGAPMRVIEAQWRLIQMEIAEYQRAAGEQSG